MPNLFLLGGENIHKQDARTVNESAFAQAGGSPSVLVLPWAKASFDRKYHMQKLLFDYLLKLGASNVTIIDYSDNSQKIAEQLNEADMVYLTGGLPSVLIERLGKMGMDLLLSNFKGVIVGRSAGALALCRKCIVTIRNTSRVRVVDGIGLVNLTLKTHYHPKNDEPLLCLSKQEPIYAVPKSSAVICSNGSLSFINEVFQFYNGEKLRLN
jgi:dipeptidase E